MPEGSNRISLLRPGAVEVNAAGSQVRSEPTEFKAWALRRDRSGREFELSDTVTSDLVVQFEIRRRKSLELLDASWTVVDRLGRVYDIEAVRESPFGMGRRHIIIVARITNRVVTITESPRDFEVSVNGNFIAVGGDTIIVRKGFG